MGNACSSVPARLPRQSMQRKRRHRNVNRRVNLSSTDPSTGTRSLSIAVAVGARAPWKGTDTAHAVAAAVAPPRSATLANVGRRFSNWNFSAIVNYRRGAEDLTGRAGSASADTASGRDVPVRDVHVLPEVLVGRRGARRRRRRTEGTCVRSRRVFGCG